MERTRRHHGAAVTTPGAFAAVNGEKTLAEWATQVGGPSTQITEGEPPWLTRAVDVFGGTTTATLDAPDLKVLYAQIGHLALEHDL